MRRVDAYLTRNAQTVWPAALVYCEVQPGKEIWTLEKDGPSPEGFSLEPLGLGGTFGEARAALTAILKSEAARNAGGIPPHSNSLGDKNMKSLNDMAQDVEHLSDKIQLLMQLVDPERDSFIYHCLEANMTKAQIDAILNLMDVVWKETKKKNGKPMEHHEFEQLVYESVPQRSGDYHFAEGIVSTLFANGKYKEVFKHMQKSGMNIHDYTKD